MSNDQKILIIIQEARNLHHQLELQEQIILKADSALNQCEITIASCNDKISADSAYYDTKIKSQDELIENEKRANRKLERRVLIFKAIAIAEPIALIFSLLVLK